MHKMHGRRENSFLCPFRDCKRSSVGFTRKDNRAEHIRRVHSESDMSADMHGLVIRRDTSPDRKARKKRSLSEPDNKEIRKEIKRLREENDEKDLRLRDLEQAVRDLQ
jgi:hypothetical protein